MISFFQHVFIPVQRDGWCPLYWWNQANLTSSSFTLSYARCSGQAVLGFLCVAAFLADLSDGFSFLLTEFKSGWHAVKLKSNILILCWAEAHPKNVCGLVCAFPLYLHPRKWVLKCKNLVLLIILFLKSHSCFFPPSLSGERRKIFCCSEDGFFPQCYTWTLPEPIAERRYHL